MPTHARQQIREAFKALLTGLPTTGANAFSGRSHALAGREVPGWIVVAASEGNEVSARDAVLKLDRGAEIVLVGYGKGAAVQDVLDTMAMEAEQAVGFAIEDRHSALAMLVKEAILSRTEIRFDTEADENSGEIRLTYQVLYRTARKAPETAIQ